MIVNRWLNAVTWEAAIVLRYRFSSEQSCVIVPWLSRLASSGNEILHDVTIRYFDWYAVRPDLGQRTSHVGWIEERRGTVLLTECAGVLVAADCVGRA